jgi:hypothetical protein
MATRMKTSITLSKFGCQYLTLRIHGTDSASQHVMQDLTAKVGGSPPHYAAAGRTCTAAPRDWRCILGSLVIERRLHVD